MSALVALPQGFAGWAQERRDAMNARAMNVTEHIHGPHHPYAGPGEARPDVTGPEDQILMAMRRFIEGEEEFWPSSTYWL